MIKAEEVLQIELLLNFTNTLFVKAVAFKDVEIINELHNIRHGIYYDKDFNYECILEKLKSIDIKLKTKYS